MRKSVTPNIREAVPGTLDRSEFLGVNTLIVGAPSVGKSYSIQKAGVEPAQSFPEAVESAGLSAIDDLYLALQREGNMTALETLLREDKGVVLSVRPRELDWLFQRGEVNLGEEFLEAVDEIVLLRYDEEADRDRLRAVVEAYWTDDGVPVGDVDTETLWQECSMLADEGTLSYPSYTFEHPLITDRLGVERYDRTLVPGLLTYVSYESIEEGIFPDSVNSVGLEAVEDTLSYLGVSWPERVFDTLSSGLSSIAPDGISMGFDSETVEGLAKQAAPMAGMTLAGPGALFGGLGLLYCLFGPRNLRMEDVENEFSCLLSKELTPPARAQLEARLDLPPRTLDNVFELGRPENAQRLQRLLDIDSEVVASLEEAAGTDGDIGNAVAVLDETLDAEGRRSLGILEELVQGATSPLSALGEELREQEAKIVGENGAHSGTIPDGDGGALPRVKQTVDKIADTETPLLVLRGPKGTGKTTTVYRAGQKLEADGYEFVRASFEGYSSRFVGEVIRDISPSAPIALYVPYAGNGSGVMPGDREALREIRALLDEGAVESVILECRSELSGQLETNFKQVESSGVETHYWPQGEFIEFGTLDDDTIASLVRTVGSQLDHEFDEDTVDEVIRLAAGNPEIAKLAVGAAVNNDNLSQFDTAPQLIRKQIFGGLEAGSSAEAILYVLAITGGASTESLLRILGALPDVEAPDSVRSLQTIARPLSGYLNSAVRTIVADRDTFETVDDDQQWRIQPDVFADAVFLDTLGSPGDQNRPFERVYIGLYDSLDEETFGTVAERIARNFTTAYSAVRPRINRLDDSGTDELRAYRRSVGQMASWFIRNRPNKTDETGNFQRCLNIVLSGGVPVPLSTSSSPEGLDDHITAALKDGTLTEGFVQRVLPRLLIGHLRLPENESDTDTVAAFIDQVLHETTTESGHQYHRALSSTYGIAVAALVPAFNALPPTEAEDTESLLRELVELSIERYDDETADGGLRKHCQLLFHRALCEVAGERSEEYVSQGGSRPRDTGQWPDAMEAVIRTCPYVDQGERAQLVADVYGRAIARLASLNVLQLPRDNTVSIAGSATVDQTEPITEWLPKFVDWIDIASRESYVESRSEFLNSSLTQALVPIESEMSGGVVLQWTNALCEAIEELWHGLDSSERDALVVRLPQTVIRTMMTNVSPVACRRWAPNVLVPVFASLADPSDVPDAESLFNAWTRGHWQILLTLDPEMNDWWPLTLCDLSERTADEMGLDIHTESLQWRLLGALLSDIIERIVVDEETVEEGWLDLFRRYIRDDAPKTSVFEGLKYQQGSGMVVDPEFDRGWGGEEFALNVTVEALQQTIFKMLEDEVPRQSVDITVSFAAETPQHLIDASDSDDGAADSNLSQNTAEAAAKTLFERIIARSLFRTLGGVQPSVFNSVVALILDPATEVSWTPDEDSKSSAVRLERLCSALIGEGMESATPEALAEVLDLVGQVMRAKVDWVEATLADETFVIAMGAGLGSHLQRMRTEEKWTVSFEGVLSAVGEVTREYSSVTTQTIAVEVIAESLHTQPDREGALKWLFERAEAVIDPTDPLEQFEYATILHEQFNDVEPATEAAAKHYQAAVEARPDSAQYQLWWGDFLLNVKDDPKQALSAFETAAELAPDRPDVHVGAARSLRALGKENEARERYRTAIDVDLESWRANYEFAVMLSEDSDTPAQAKEYYERAFDGTEVRNPDMHLQYAEYLNETLGDQDSAEVHYRRAVELAPESPVIHRRLANFLESNGKQNEAEKFRQRAKELSSNE